MQTTIGQRKSDYMRKRYTDRINSGLCGGCGVKSSTKKCDSCREKQRIRQKNKRDERLAKGQCTRCTITLDREGWLCSKCLIEDNKRGAKRSANRVKQGLCYHCGGNLELNYQIDKTRRYVQCAKCYFQHMAGLHLGSNKFGAELQALFDKQEGKCAYTGEALILGKTASVDHIQARSRGGKDTIDNLQWVTKTVNKMKQEIGHSEFISLCRLIASRIN